MATTRAPELKSINSNMVPDLSESKPVDLDCSVQNKKAFEMFMDEMDLLSATYSTALEEEIVLYGSQSSEKQPKRNVSEIKPTEREYGSLTNKRDSFTQTDSFDKEAEGLDISAAIRQADQNKLRGDVPNNIPSSERSVNTVPVKGNENIVLIPTSSSIPTTSSRTFILSNERKLKQQHYKSPTCSEWDKFLENKDNETNGNIAVTSKTCKNVNKVCLPRSVDSYSRQSNNEDRVTLDTLITCQQTEALHTDFKRRKQEFPTPSKSVKADTSSGYLTDIVSNLPFRSNTRNDEQRTRKYFHVLYQSFNITVNK